MSAWGASCGPGSRVVRALADLFQAGKKKGRPPTGGRPFLLLLSRSLELLAALQPTLIRRRQPPTPLFVDDLQHHPPDQKDGRYLEEEKRGQAESQGQDRAYDRQRDASHNECDEPDGEEGQQCTDYFSISCSACRGTL